jgi:hypothetical protein
MSSVAISPERLHSGGNNAKQEEARRIALILLDCHKWNIRCDVVDLLAYHGQV